MQDLNGELEVKVAKIIGEKQPEKLYILIYIHYFYGVKEYHDLQLIFAFFFFAFFA